MPKVWYPHCFISLHNVLRFFSIAGISLMKEAICLDTKSMIPYTNKMAKKIDSNMAPAFGTRHLVINISTGRSKIENKKEKAKGVRISWPR
jgi:hypothetical protein